MGRLAGRIDMWLVMDIGDYDVIGCRYEHHQVSQLVPLSLIEEVVLFHLHRHGGCGEGSSLGVFFEDDLCQVRVLLFDDFELALDLRPALVHLGRDHGEIASILFQQPH